MPKEFESRAFRSQSGSESLKTTVPQSVATVLGLEPGDAIRWELDVESRSARVRRAGASDSGQTSRVASELGSGIGPSGPAKKSRRR